MASLLSHVQNVTFLYKRILVLHHMLPLHFKALGDQYVKDQFRKHKYEGMGEILFHCARKEMLSELQEHLKTTISSNIAPFIYRICQSYAIVLWKQANETLHSPGGKGICVASLSQETLNCFCEEQIGQLQYTH
ncbi:hypothetical protein XELAEV_18030889mg [Xenopus laevis]|uniref:Succinate dehydrogenase assembly factor 3 n=1 Tax=Xenopus laevis TaxID=8355 RepID=A0A974CN70_XENLA|nr:hypothetical protein XELAEV_18030889mg [Xenopus laevis]